MVTLEIITWTLAQTCMTFNNCLATDCKNVHGLTCIRPEPQQRLNFIRDLKAEF